MNGGRFIEFLKALGSFPGKIFLIVDVAGFPKRDIGS